MVEEALNEIIGCLISITRNTERGWFILEIGIPDKWVFSGNNDIECEIVNELDTGKIIDVYPKNNNINIDDLIDFVKLIIDINEKISEKEMEIYKRFEDTKLELTNELKEYYREFDGIKFKSLKPNDDESKPKTSKSKKSKEIDDEVNKENKEESEEIKPE